MPGSSSRALLARFTPAFILVWREGALPWRADALAGFTVAIVALPLAMALGIASGAAPNQGLITAVVAGFFVSALGGSRVQIGGPTGAFVVIVAGIIAKHGYPGLVLATFLAGFLLIIAGYAGLGRLIRFIPMPVITGFTAGIALIIASSQVGDFLGLPAGPAQSEFLAKWQTYAAALPTVSVPALAVGSGTLFIVILLRRLAPQLPALLLALATATIAVTFLHLPVDTIGDRFPNMPSGIPAPHLPGFSVALLREILPSSLTIALLAGIEALLSAVVADGMTGYSHRSGQELVGQGVANIASACFGGVPATGAIARTATNIRAGGRTPLAGMFHAAFLLLFMQAGAQLITRVPMAALAALLLVVAWGMSEIDRFRAILGMEPGDRVLLLLTFTLTVFVDLTVAIGVGVTLASLLFMARMSEHTGLLSDELSVEDPAQRKSLPADVEVFRFAGPMFFGVAGEMLDALHRIARTPKIIILRMDRVPYIDASGLAALAAFVRRAQAGGTRIILTELRQQPGALLDRRWHEFSGVRRAATFHGALDEVESSRQATP